MHSRVPAAHVRRRSGLPCTGIRCVTAKHARRTQPPTQSDEVCVMSRSHHPTTTHHTRPPPNTPDHASASPCMHAATTMRSLTVNTKKRQVSWHPVNGCRKLSVKRCTPPLRPHTRDSWLRVLPAGSRLSMAITARDKPCLPGTAQTPAGL